VPRFGQQLVQLVRRQVRREDWRALAAPSMAMVLSLTLLGSAADVGPPGPRWSKSQLEQLTQWVNTAPQDALARPDTALFDDALRSGRKARINPAATALALSLAQLHLTGAAPQAERADWHIPDTDVKRALAPELEAAVANDTLESFFTSLRPAHPTYTALREALITEPDAQQRERIARNLERWRWLPQSLGEDYVLANAASFDVALVRGGSEQQRWVTVSGNPKTPTPAITAVATHVIINPWWEVPQSISSVSAMSARGGYVRVGNRYRQRPGPGNSLGQMKVVMYNPWNIYLHDTPSRYLFGQRERAFSHGCIRVNDALGFARAVAGGALTRDRLDRILKPKEGEEKQEVVTVTVPLARALPVYVTYFTVDTDAQGRVRFHKDIYGHDKQLLAFAVPQAAQLALR
jgi:murein L,D-transpeptidase YcbB/YkuD